MLYKNTTERPCIVVDVQRDYDSIVTEIPVVPTFAIIVLVAGIGDQPLNEVIAKEEFKKVMPIVSTLSLPGTGGPINTTPEWKSHPKHKVPSYILCIPIKDYAQNLQNQHRLE
ncbi:hypothetical protein HDV02_006782, partial [Globomyces sp. JEL0801]